MLERCNLIIYLGSCWFIHIHGYIEEICTVKIFNGSTKDKMFIFGSRSHHNVRRLQFRLVAYAWNSDREVPQ